MFEGRRHLSRLTAAGWLGDGKFKAASLWASCPHLRSSHPVACLLLFEPQERERPERVSIGSWAVFRVKSNAGCRRFPLGTRELHPTVPGSAHPFQGLKRKGGDSVVPSRVVKAGPLTLQPVRGTRLGPPETVANERCVSLTGTFLRSSYVEDVYREKGPFRLEQEGQKEGSCVWGWGECCHPRSPCRAAGCKQATCFALAKCHLSQQHGAVLFGRCQASPKRVYLVPYILFHRRWSPGTA